MFMDFLDLLPRPLRYVVFYGLFTIGIFTKPVYTLGILAMLLIAALISPKHWLTPWGPEPVERKRVLKIYGTALVFFYLLAYGLTPTDPVAIQANPRSAATATSTAPASTEVAPPKAPSSKKYDTVGTASNVTFQIIDMKVQRSLGSRQTQNLFIVPVVAVKNSQNDAIMLSFSLFTLVDERGREFSPLDTMDAYMMKENDQFTDKLNPGLTAQIAIPFEVPRDVASLTLRCQGGITGGTVVLRLDPPQKDASASAPKRSAAIGLMAKLKTDENAYRVTTPGANPAFTLTAGDVVQIIGEDNRGMYYQIKWKNEQGYVKRSALQLFAN